MKVRLLTDIAGIGFMAESGAEVDLPPDEARRMIESGQAMPVQAETENPERRAEKPLEKRSARK